MMRLGASLLGIALMVQPASAGQEVSNDMSQLVADFGELSRTENLDLLVVHLNDKTTDVLFDPPAKYSFRAQARQATMFYVLGTANQDLTVDTEFMIRQNVVEMRLSPHNLQGFERGTTIAAGETFTGILTLPQLITLNLPFSIVHGPCDGEILRGCHILEFEFTPNILSQLRTP